jgi:N-acetylglucosaminyldiphosphoundecaprenol N-acetyl-beta-D-mannosaminyltransferase
MQTSQVPSAREHPPRRWLFGVPIDALQLEDVLDAAERAIKDRQRLLVSVVNAAKIVEMSREPVLREAVLRGDLILADGMSIVWAGRLLRQPLPERVAGIDVMLGLLRRADAARYRVYLFGATPQVLDAAVASVRAGHPGVVIAGSHHGYYEPAEEQRIAEQISACAPDILFVANVSPIKEMFLARFVDRMNVPVCLGVGGSFDVLAGERRRAPALWQRWGLEWAYRLAQEPRRLWRRYLGTNLAFARLTVAELIKGRGGPS